jgi:hypothetical protein
MEPVAIALDKLQGEEQGVSGMSAAHSGRHTDEVRGCPDQASDVLRPISACPAGWH